MQVYNYLLNAISSKGAAFLILIDPDKSPENIEEFIHHCEYSGADGFLAGSSLMLNNDFDNFLRRIKLSTNLPVIIFPGAVDQVSPNADAILFLSVISGRNPEHLIGKHVLASPLIKKADIEPISTGYILIESGRLTTAQYISNSLPIPKNKPEIAAATALAGEYLGMKLIYLEAGSGADNSVPDEIINSVSKECSIPVIVGGGIISPDEARDKVECGANIIVVGNFFENKNNWNFIKNFADAVHVKIPVKV